MGDSAVSKWAAGASYGPVLSQTDLYLLNTELQLHPILHGTDPGFHLIFNLVTGSTGGFNNEARDRDIPFTAKDEPATLPRVTDLIIITELSPWCTIVHNDRGVTTGDVCGTIWKEYTENYITEAEFSSLPARLQEQVKRVAQNNQASGGWPGAMYYNTPQPNRYKRVDWLRDKIYFEGLTKKDHYTSSRLGFKAPNIFVMNLAS
ncbi:hypothetical protein JVT61DRAFT_2749 [Boletus reticuloceps]|uniref:DUF6699 domain-containing protein n=2 Tax=Boletus TaxID=5369 RepID=A0A8I2YRZ2_9AGAM|nr:hypothetical protein EV363DRAFT_1174197 [Boletus edulis]KAF8437460.1 hypothetical protein L210DRAFT_3405563 [Boletus edulis BED1]KAG6375883.1 hypothetical protein JVT61DRAFT_2749 [Boletus reticuloceps]